MTNDDTNGDDISEYKCLFGRFLRPRNSLGICRVSKQVSPLAPSALPLRLSEADSGPCSLMSIWPQSFILLPMQQSLTMSVRVSLQSVTMTPCSRDNDSKIISSSALPASLLMIILRHVHCSQSLSPVCEKYQLRFAAAKITDWVGVW